MEAKHCTQILKIKGKQKQEILKRILVVTLSLRIIEESSEISTKSVNIEESFMKPAF